MCCLRLWRFKIWLCFRVLKIRGLPVFPRIWCLLEFHLHAGWSCDGRVDQCIFIVVGDSASNGFVESLLLGRFAQLVSPCRLRLLLALCLDQRRLELSENKINQSVNFSSISGLTWIPQFWRTSCSDFEILTKYASLFEFVNFRVCFGFWWNVETRTSFPARSAPPCVSWPASPPPFFSLLPVEVALVSRPPSSSSRVPQAFRRSSTAAWGRQWFCRLFERIVRSRRRPCWCPLPSQSTESILFVMDLDFDTIELWFRDFDRF